MIRHAMILAAGRGTRLAPLTHTTPKPLIQVAGRPMLAHLIDFLRRGGIEEVVMNDGGGIKAGPVGRVLRLAMGVALVVEGGRHLVGARLGLTLGAFSYFAAEFVAYALMHALISRRATPARPTSTGRRSACSLPSARQI